MGTRRGSCEFKCRDSKTALMWTTVGSQGEFRGWQVRLC